MIISCVHLFSLFSVSACLQVLFFLLSLPVYLWSCFKRMFTSRCLCAIIRQCAITLSLNRCPPLCFLFVLLNCNCSLSAAPECTLCLLAFFRSPLLEFKVSFHLLRGSNSFPALNRTFLLSYK